MCLRYLCRQQEALGRKKDLEVLSRSKVSILVSNRAE